MTTPRLSASVRPSAPWDDDAEIVRQILAGSRKHFDMLYDAYFSRVFRFSLKMLHDVGEAEDLTQEVFIAVFRALPTFQGNSTLLSWIFGIARNKAHHRFRRLSKRTDPIEYEALEVPSGEALPDDVVDARRLLGLCQLAVEDQLTPAQQRIFQLRHLRQQSIRNIADSVGKSEDAVKTNLCRIRKALATAIPGLGQLLDS